MNNRENVYIALQYLKECGHTELGYLGSTTGAENFNERHDAFIKYVKELDFHFNPRNEFRLKPTMLGARDDFSKFLEQKPELPPCFFAENDTIALGAMKALKEKGYKIPQEDVYKRQMWHHAGREPVLQHKDFGFQAVAVPGGLHIL